MGAEAAVRPVAGTPAPSAPAPVLRMLGWVASVLLIAAALLPLLPKAASPRAALTLEVAGELRRVSAESVRNAVAAQLNTDFYELDLGAVRGAVEQLPWVAGARVERSWPATVRIEVREHRAVARWDAAALLSDADVVFVPPAIGAEFDALPRLAGPPGQQGAVHAAYAELAAELADTPFVPQRLVQNARGEWTATTQDGIELRLGREAPTTAVARLAGPVRTALEGRLQEVTYVDLHYFNGFAVGWRDGGAGDPRSRVASAEGRNE